MKTGHEKATIATPHVSTVAPHWQGSIAQAIDAAKADSTKPSAEQSLADSSVPGHNFNPGISQLTARFGSTSSGDPNDHSSTPTGVTNPVDALRSAAANLFDSGSHDPTQKGDLHDDWIHGGRPSEADLRALLGGSGSGG